jgi:hypothetical protein
VFVPAGVKHALVVESAEARFLALAMPPGKLEAFLDELGQPATQAVLPPPLPARQTLLCSPPPPRGTVSRSLALRRVLPPRPHLEPAIPGEEDEMSPLGGPAAPAREPTLGLTALLNG